MTHRAYFEDAYTTVFTARVREMVALSDDRKGLILDKTYFYPTSGGQPHDLGTLNGQAVEDVYIRENDGAIVHVTRNPVLGDEVTGEISWSRRFDHMQHHTGQHILSRAFIEAAGAGTESFHLGETSITIDLDKPDLSPEEVEACETLANAIIWQNLPVTVQFLAQAEAATAGLRKLPEIEGDRVRLVQIGDFDHTACGGTHVARTGEVGLIKIVGLENRRGQLRVSFLCGQRALADYRDKHAIVINVANAFTTAYTELESVTQKLREDLKRDQKELQQLRKVQLAFQAAAMRQAARQLKGILVVRKVLANGEPGELRTLARELAAAPGVVALLAATGERTHFVVSCAEDVAVGADELLQVALTAFGAGKGGGSATMAQGGGPSSGSSQVEEALMASEQHLLLRIEQGGNGDSSAG